MVGEDVDQRPTEFSVHEDAVAQLSTPLHTLTKGGSTEARAGSAKWKDVGKETFERFVQFAYTGDYSIPNTAKRNDNAQSKPSEFEIASHLSSPTVLNGSQNPIESAKSDEPRISDVNGTDKPVTDTVDREPGPDKVDDDSGSILNYPSITNKKNKKKKRKKTVNGAEPEQDKELAELQELITQNEPPEEEAVAQPEQNAEPETVIPVAQLESQEQASHILVADFHTLTYPLIASRDNYEGTCEPSADFEKDHSYSNVLLSHASLYVLGDTQLVDSLKALALFKLHKTLCTFQLDDENIGDITDLARYAYSGEDKPMEDGLGGLRGLVCQYMAIHAVELSGDARFMNLLAGGGQIVKDFFRFQLQRIQ